jgi:molybdopterin/thiamine biosynthesis adenylyltransferase
VTLEEESGMTSTRIALIGVGGTGCALLPLLCALPFDGITLIDGDTVEASNLERQLLFSQEDVGKPKVHCAATRQQQLANGKRLVPEFRFVDARNCNDLLQGHHLVADCTDDLVVRGLIEDCCRNLLIPLVSGAVHGHQVQVITVHEKIKPPAESSFFRGRASEDQLGCEMQQVPAAITTLTAALMALRIRDIINGGSGLVGVMDLVDGEHGHWMRIQGPGTDEFMDTPVTPLHRG